MVKQIKLLLAEDNLINQRVAKSVLDRLEIPFDIVNDGEQAIQAVQKFDYSLVLMDIKMPNLDGVSATIKIRKELKMLDLPIVALTANSTQQDKDNCFNAGMNDFITKPLLPEKLCKILEKYLEK
ncbi:MAG: response regulator [Saprospiraceae bacterium]|nr:response regulator [Saprospiraceae bacterium]